MVLVPKTQGEGKRLAFTMVLVPKTNGEGKRPLPSPWFWCQKHTPSVALTIVFVPKTQNVRRVTPYPSREVSDARRYQTRGAEGAYAKGGGGGQEDR